MSKMPEYDPVDDVEMLIGKFIANEIDEEEGERLLAFLRAHPEWDQKLYEQKRLADLLAGPNDESPRDHELKTELLSELYQHYEKIADYSQSNTARRRLMLLVYAGSVLGIVFAVVGLAHAFFTIPEFSHPTRVLMVSPFTQTSPAVALLSHEIDVKWADTMDPAPQKGTALIPGNYEFHEGTVMIQFYGGATLIAQGPCRMAIESATVVSCFQGRFSVEATGLADTFQLSSPDFETVKGERYLFDLSGVESILHNISGVLEWERSGAGEAGRLKAGEGFRATKNAMTPTIPSDGDQYLSPERMIDLSENEASRNLARWKESREQWLRDPSLCLYFDFQCDAETRKTNRLANRVRDHRNAPVEATLVGGRPGAGRWAGKESLEFRTVSDRLLVSIPEPLDDVTMSVSLRADEIERNLNSIFMTERFGLGALHWQILNNIDNGRRGAVRIGLFEGRPGKYKADNFDSPVVFGNETLGAWVRLAVVLDAEHRTVSHYLNGKLLSRHDVPFPMRFDLKKVEIGNWSSDTPINPIRNFVGGFEEFMLFSRALTEEEVLLLHSVGH